MITSCGLTDMDTDGQMDTPWTLRPINHMNSLNGRKKNLQLTNENGAIIMWLILNATIIIMALRIQSSWIKQKIFSQPNNISYSLKNNNTCLFKTKQQWFGNKQRIESVSPTTDDFFILLQLAWIGSLFVCCHDKVSTAQKIWPY